MQIVSTDIPIFLRLIADLFPSMDLAPKVSVILYQRQSKGSLFPTICHAAVWLCTQVERPHSLHLHSGLIFVFSHLFSLPFISYHLFFVSLIVLFDPVIENYEAPVTLINMRFLFASSMMATPALRLCSTWATRLVLLYILAPKSCGQWQHVLSNTSR